MVIIAWTVLGLASGLLARHTLTARPGASGRAVTMKVLIPALPPANGTKPVSAAAANQRP